MLRLLTILIRTFLTTLWSRWRRGPRLPSWGFQFEWMVAFLRQDFAESAAWPYSRLRAELNGRRYPARFARQVTTSQELLGGVPAVRFTPPDAASGTVLYLHGGSYIFGSVGTTHRELVAELALRSRRVVLGIDYRLAPEHPFPAALEDALAAFAALVESGIAPSTLVVAGDSAGGNLALALQLALRERGREQARAAVLLSPWLDLAARRPSCRAADDLDYGQTPFLLQHARDFAGGVPLEDPRLSLIDADLAGLAPLFVLVGGAERLHDEGLELAERARQSGVQVESCVAHELPHNPPALSALHPEAARAFGVACEFVSKSLS